MILAISGSIGILIFLALFGVKILIWFSLGIDRLRGGTPASQQAAQTILFPPLLDPVPTATNSSFLKISGSGQPETTVSLYVNEAEGRKMSIAKDGTFSFASVRLAEGANTISAKILDDKNNMSDLSNVVSIIMKKTPPSLDVTSPSDNQTISDDNNIVNVSGKSDSDTTVTVNDRLVVVQSDGSFTYQYPLNQGENKLKIVATDVAGNQTIIDRTVKYEK